MRGSRSGSHAAGNGPSLRVAVIGVYDGAVAAFNGHDPADLAHVAVDILDFVVREEGDALGVV